MVISMKPTRTSTLLRAVYRDLDSDFRVDSDGFPTGHSVDHEFPNPDHFTDPRAFAREYLIYNIARKREMSEPTSKQMRASLEKWADSEYRCHVVNQCGRWVDPIDKAQRDRFSRLDQSMRALISHILMDEWPVMEFSPTGGASATLSRKYSVPSSKVDGTPLTEDLQPHKCAPASQDYLELMLMANPGVARRFMRARDKLLDSTLDPFGDQLEFSESEISDLAEWLCSGAQPAVFTYVPKDWKTIRLIAQSNTISIMVQKTFGDTIRKALRAKVGIDLNDQRINQEWAEIGSLTGLVATVDLSAASDSISINLVKLLPRRWQAYVLASRDTHVRVKENVHQLAMLAGMGNGYIFELESLLFYAMTRVVVEELNLDTSMISVYGDDIICPVGAVKLLEEYMLYHGFLFNPDKSFASGPFRESCGKHYFKGVDVTPWYVKSDLNEPSELYHLYNGLSEWSSRTGYPLDKCLTQISNCIRPKERYLVPPSWSTKSGFHYACDGIKLPSKRWNKNYQRYEIVWTVLAPKPQLDISNMLPVSMAVTNSLMQLEASKVVCDSSWFRSIVERLPSKRLMLLQRCDLQPQILEKESSGVYWSTQPVYRWTKHRDVSPGGDA